jgi:hypothetical protein
MKQKENKFKYKPVKFCVNCLRETKKCKCVVKVVELVERCQNCGEMIMDDWSYCSTCGYEVPYEK